MPVTKPLSRVATVIVPAILSLSTATAQTPGAPAAATHCAAQPGAAQGAEAFRDIGCLLDRLVRDRQLPGASVLVLNHGRETYFSAAGLRDVEAAAPLQRDTIFRIYSMTKPITTAAVMLLVEDGKIRLDDPITKFVPEFAATGVYSGVTAGAVQTTPVVRPITVENLLTHTSGLSYSFQRGTPVAALYANSPIAGDRWRFDPAFGGSAGLARTLAGLPLAYQPGTRWHYSMSLDVAAIIVERASGMPFGDFLQKRLFGPLGMVDSGFNVPPEKAGRLASLYGPGPDGSFRLVDAAGASPLVRDAPLFSGGGGLVSTIDDYARFAQMLANGGRYNGRRILSRQSVQAMMRNHLPADQLTELAATARFGLGGSGEGMGFGYGGAVVLQPGAGGGSAGEYLWGGAASTTFWVDPARDVVVVFMTQLIPPTYSVRDELHTLTYRALARRDHRN